MESKVFSRRLATNHKALAYSTCFKEFGVMTSCEGKEPI